MAVVGFSNGDGDIDLPQFRALVRGVSERKFTFALKQEMQKEEIFKLQSRKSLVDPEENEDWVGRVSTTLVTPRMKTRVTGVPEEFHHRKGVLAMKTQDLSSWETQYRVDLHSAGIDNDNAKVLRASSGTKARVRYHEETMAVQRCLRKQEILVEQLNKRLVSEIDMQGAEAALSTHEYQLSVVLWEFSMLCNLVVFQRLINSEIAYGLEYTPNEIWHTFKDHGFASMVDEMIYCSWVKDWIPKEETVLSSTQSTSNTICKALIADLTKCKEYFFQH